ncbi:MAG: hypothetical protein EOP48_04935 [Sphingobacteriales bacterium]|nr:MAG: hypothetical protein EOP48_04935 [Sphingobacteriales bacterium]
MHLLTATPSTLCASSMTTIPETIKDRKVIYVDIQQELQEFEAADLMNWVLFVIEDNIHNPILGQFADLCIEKDVLYVCAAGKACSEVDDLFDFKMVEREQAGGKLPSWYQPDDDVLMTSWHHDFDEGFWFALTTANYENLPIETVVVANLTRGSYLPTIQRLTEKIAEGWLPPD